jgi:hypothetical protein
MAANLISLNGVELTDQGRTFNEGSAEKNVDMELSNGDTRRYRKATKRTFSINWDWCPDSSSRTHDLKAGRDGIRAAAYSGTSMIFVVRNHPTTTETYTVLLDSYSEEIIRRDIVSNVYFYTISLSLIEV